MAYGKDPIQELKDTFNKGFTDGAKKQALSLLSKLISACPVDKPEILKKLEDLKALANKDVTAFFKEFKTAGPEIGKAIPNAAEIWKSK
jgi:hypothetical protein